MVRIDNGVSVITTAYNHQDTIERAIDSVRMQQGVGREHIVIDDTGRKNGMMKTYQEAFKRCTGKYITFCDGDDYWFDAYKLKFQVQYMDNHPECGLCITKVYDEVGGKLVDRIPPASHINKNMSFDTLLRGKANIHAQSYMIRKSDFDKYVDFDMFAEKFALWDYPIVLELIQHTKFHCLDFYSAVNVINEESVTHTKSRAKRIQYLKEQYRVKWYYIRKYGCKFSTKIYLIYRILRSIYSVGFKRWI
jgi:glycosyltransferase involved in cell wall biosynthesis